MIKIEQTEISGFGAAIRGMRNPMNSWDKMDSHVCNYDEYDCDCPMVANGDEPGEECNDGKWKFCIGENDYALMKRLADGASCHAKYRRMMLVTCDITAPLYWWKEFDTYKVGTVANSCSTMHKIHAKEFTLDDFSHEHLMQYSMEILDDAIIQLNFWRKIYLSGGQVNNYDGTDRIFEPKDKDAWWQMIQLLPSSYNQKRTVLLNYEVLANIYKWRKNHKLDEWRDFCRWIEQLPYSNVIVRECGCIADE
jgi:hypothetical protein